MTSTNRHPDTIFEYVGENIDNWRTPQDIFPLHMQHYSGADGKCQSFSLLYGCKTIETIEQSSGRFLSNSSTRHKRGLKKMLCFVRIVVYCGK